MRKGFTPLMVLDPQGRLIGIATGSDATSEHEWGCKPLMQELTGMEQLSRRDLAAKLMKSSPRPKIPDLMAAKRITRDLENVIFQTREINGEVEASLAYCANYRVDAFSPSVLSELDFSSFSEPKDIAGAWDENSFGFKVKGAKKVEQLRQFAEAMIAGKAIFAGTFLEAQGGKRLGGVIIAIEDLLRPEHRTAMKKAQADFEADLRLFGKAKTDELSRLSRQLSGRSITHIWPVWKNGDVDGDVLYAINPGHNVDASYYGPYSFEQLSDWLSSGATTPLRPVKEKPIFMPLKA